MEPKPSTIALAAILTQFFITVILSIGASIIQRHFNRPSFEPAERKTGLTILYLILLGTLLMLGALLFSDAIAPGWSPILSSPDIPTIPFAPLISIMFLVNILVTTIAIAMTGGSYESPFSPVLLTIPALAILLREPFVWIVIYMGTISCAFLATLYLELSPDAKRVENAPLKRAYLIISMMCFLLTSIVAYMTRPK